MTPEKLMSMAPNDMGLAEILQLQVFAVETLNDLGAAQKEIEELKIEKDDIRRLDINACDDAQKWMEGCFKADGNVNRLTAENSALKDKIDAVQKGVDSIIHGPGGSVETIKRLESENSALKARCERMKELINLHLCPSCEACSNPGRVLYDTHGEGKFWLCERRDGDHDSDHYDGVVVIDLREALRADEGSSDADSAN